MSIRSRALRKIKKPAPSNDATISVDALHSIVAAARPLIEDWLDIADQLAAFRETAAEKNLDWSQIKNLIKAQILDERDDGDRVAKLSAKAGKLSEYLELLSGNSGDKKSPNSSSGGVEGRHATTGNMPGSVPGEETSSPAPRFVRTAGAGTATQSSAGVAPSPLEANSDGEPVDGSAAAPSGQREPDGDTGFPAGSPPTIPIPDVPPRPIASGQASHEYRDAEATPRAPSTDVASQIPEADIPSFADRRHELVRA